MDELERFLANQPVNDADNASRLLREIAYERLKDALRHADVRPGSPLSEIRLSKLLGVSRTPVREALQQLAQEGLVQIIPGRAVTVAVPSIHEVLNVVHVRSLLEPEVTRLVAEAISPSHLDALWQALADMETAVAQNDQAGWSQADTRFHETISHACPNELLSDLALQMRNRVHYLANIDSQTNPARLAACTQEHRQIVEAIAAREAQTAEQMVRDHIDKLRQSLFNRLAYSQ
jgi:DNA-binding GntR family transcriptional regulator